MVYDTRFGLPLSIQRGDDTTRFACDERGHVTMKETPAEITTLTYNMRVNKVTRVERRDRRSPKAPVTWSRFEYDPSGNVTFAENSDKKQVRLTYDANGRIGEVIDKDGARIVFTYNQNSKPTLMRRTHPGGKEDFIKVTYRASGGIENVESSGGRQTSVEITNAFQNLLDITRPAGVTLTH